MHVDVHRTPNAIGAELKELTFRTARSIDVVEVGENLGRVVISTNLGQQVGSCEFVALTAFCTRSSRY